MYAHMFSWWYCAVLTPEGYICICPHNVFNPFTFFPFFFTLSVFLMFSLMSFPSVPRQLTAVNDKMAEYTNAPGTSSLNAALMHTLQRHRDILQVWPHIPLNCFSFVYFQYSSCAYSLHLLYLAKTVKYTTVLWSRHASVCFSLWC